MIDQVAFEAHHTAVVIRQQVIMVYGRPYVLFNLIITGQDYSSTQIGRQVPCLWV